MISLLLYIIMSMYFTLDIKYHHQIKRGVRVSAMALLGVFLLAPLLMLTAIILMIRREIYASNRNK